MILFQKSTVVFRLSMLLVMLSFAASAMAQKDYFESKEGNFKVIFPGAPQVSTDDVPTDIGTIKMKSFMYEKSALEAYMVAYSDYPAEMVEVSNADDLLQGGKNGALSSFGIEKAEEEEDIKINGHPGKYFKANNNQYYVVYKMYMVGNRLYQIAILRDGAYPDKKEAKSFLNSFKLLNNVKNDPLDVHTIPSDINRTPAKKWFPLKSGVKGLFSATTISHGVHQANPLAHRNATAVLRMNGVAVEKAVFEHVLASV